MTYPPEQPYQGQPQYQAQPPYQGQPPYQAPGYQTVPQPYSPYPYATGYPAPTPPNRKVMPWIIMGIVVLVVAALVGVALVVLANNKPNKTPQANSTGTTTPPASPTGPGPGATTPGATDTPGNTGTQPPAGNGSQNMALGTPLKVTEDAGTFTVTVNKVTYRTTGCKDDGFGLSDPQSGDAYILIDVTYTTKTGVGHYNVFDWSVSDTAGKTYDDLGFFSECEPALEASNSLHGTRHGIAVVEVRKGVQHGQIIYTPGLLADTSSTWKF